MANFVCKRQLSDEAKAYIKEYFLQKVKGDKKYFVLLDDGDEVLLNEETLTENNFELFYTIINGEWFRCGIEGKTEKTIDKVLDKYLGTPK